MARHGPASLAVLFFNEWRAWQKYRLDATWFYCDVKTIVTRLVATIVNSSALELTGGYSSQHYWLPASWRYYYYLALKQYAEPMTLTSSDGVVASDIIIEVPDVVCYLILIFNSALVLKNYTLHYRYWTDWLKASYWYLDDNDRTTNDDSSDGF